MATNSKILISEKKSQTFFKGGMVLVRVGGEYYDAELFSVHKDLITARSPFFANALKPESPWVSAGDGIVTLEEDDPEMFGLYLQLIYYDNIPIIQEPVTEPEALINATADQIKEQKDQFRAKIEGSSKKEYETLSKLYGLCEMLQDISAKNHIIAAFIEASKRLREDNHNYFPTEVAIGIVYRLTTTFDPLRRLCVDMYVLSCVKRLASVSRTRKGLSNFWLWDWKSQQEPEAGNVQEFTLVLAMGSSLKGPS
ncbi:hypothetical protein CC80DRAFT_539697 [Byssothecium circinans]|uniref:BTB domain-containing protein n=1 Tax=Byssothecium circinans TaxID=147558 RepID=A0A6A5TBU0_9PLEO|nr:hypothetical protein CC80DRAFT_539697 [Byssothecium circinans]